MPRGDGTGPPTGGKAPGGGFVNWETKPGSGPGGECVCPACGKILPHRKGVPCSTLVCPDCGVSMTRNF